DGARAEAPGKAFRSCPQANRFSPCAMRPETIGVWPVRSVAQPGSALDWGSRHNAVKPTISGPFLTQNHAIVYADVTSEEPEQWQKSGMLDGSWRAEAGRKRRVRRPLKRPTPRARASTSYHTRAGPLLAGPSATATRRS